MYSLCGSVLSGGIINMKSDKEILDWLQDECKGKFSCERLFDCHADSPTFGYLDEWEVFTIPKPTCERK